MPILRDVGKVSTDGQTTIRWTIPRRMLRPNSVDTYLRSRYFKFQDRFPEESCLCVYPNGLQIRNSKGWMGVWCSLPFLPRGSAVTLCMVIAEGIEILPTKTERGDDEFYVQYHWVQRTELEDRSAELLHGEELCIVCKIVLPNERGHFAENGEESGDAVNVTNFGKCSNSENHNIKRSGKDAPKISKNISCETCKQQGYPNLRQNFKDLYIRGEDCDLLIKVKDSEFRAHRVVLKARISAFSAMLTHNMVENNEGVVKVDDCDPDVFNEFLLFVYSGSVENLSADTVCGLYVLADKYGLLDLKAICLDFMRRSLSVETICDVIGLATRHGEAELLKIATSYFLRNTKEILVTVKWKEFMVENPTEANELFFKTLNLGETKGATK